MKLRSVVCILAASLAVACTSKAQINSAGVTVRNSAPANVFFMFPVSDSSNVTAIQLGCSDSAANRNYVFVYEEQPGGSIVTYPFQVEIDCTETYSQGALGPNSAYTASLKKDITVTTADHTITISATAWTAAKVSSRTGPFWKTTGGSSQITVQ